MNEIIQRYENGLISDSKFNKLLIAQRNELQKQGKQEEANLYQFEIDFTGIGFYQSEVRVHEIGYADGTTLKFPDISKFEKIQINYYEERLNETNSLNLKATYAHLLWQIKKHQQFAKIAIDSYLLLFNKETNYNKIENHIIEAIYIAQKINYKIDKCKQGFLDLLFDDKYPIEEKEGFFIMLIHPILDLKKIFDKNDLEKIEDLCFDISKKLFEEKKYHPSIYRCKDGLKISVRTGANKHNWNLLIAQNYEEMGKVRNDLYKSTCFEKSAYFYGIVKNKEKQNELKKLYKEATKNIKLSSIQREFKIDFDKINEFSDEVSKQDIPELIMRLTHQFVVPYEELEKIIKFDKYGADLEKIGIAITIDNRGHTAQIHCSDEEKHRRRLLHILNISNQETMNVIFQSLIKSIVKGKLSIEIIMAYFSSTAWFGKNMDRKVLSEEFSTNWLNLIYPSISQFFYQFEMLINYPIYEPNWVLFIDSLTLKFEGLVRDYCELLGIVTHKTVRHKNGDITKEKDINDFLIEPKFVEKVGKTDAIFLQYLFIEKAGLNLRNKIAHSLIVHQNSYNIFYAQLLFIALLKVARFEIENE